MPKNTKNKEKKNHRIIRQPYNYSILTIQTFYNLSLIFNARLTEGISYHNCPFLFFHPANHPLL